MRVLFNLTLLLCITNTYSQEKDLIIGKWLFTEVLNESIDQNSLMYLKDEVIDKWTFVFNADHTFETSAMGGLPNGKWTHNLSENTITITTSEGSTQEFKILESSIDQLSLDLGVGKFLLKRLE